MLLVRIPNTDYGWIPSSDLFIYVILLPLTWHTPHFVLLWRHFLIRKFSAASARHETTVLVVTLCLASRPETTYGRSGFPIGQPSRQDPFIMAEAKQNALAMERNNPEQIRISSIKLKFHTVQERPFSWFWMIAVLKVTLHTFIASVALISILRWAYQSNFYYFLILFAKLP